MNAEQKRRISTQYSRQFSTVQYSTRHTTDRAEKHATEGSAWSGGASAPESHFNRGSAVLVFSSRAEPAGKLAFAGEGVEGGWMPYDVHMNFAWNSRTA